MRETWIVSRDMEWKRPGAEYMNCDSLWATVRVSMAGLIQSTDTPDRTKGITNSRDDRERGSGALNLHAAPHKHGGGFRFHSDVAAEIDSFATSCSWLHVRKREFVGATRKLYVLSRVAAT